MALTPEDLTNEYPVSPLRYRVGTASSFLASMLGAAGEGAQARATAGGTELASTLASMIDVPPSIDDPRHALFDAWASALDVLTSYTERIANEHYVRTATELASLIRLARQVSEYRYHGLAASTLLAFTLDPSAVGSSVVTIPAGTPVMSVPGPDEKPQVFETDVALEARTDWNALAPVTSRKPEIDSRAAALELAGTPRIAVGDVVLVCPGPDAVGAGSPAWTLRTVQTATPSPADGTTRIEFATPAQASAGEGQGLPGDRRQEAGVFVFRQRAALFGANAPIARDADGVALWPSYNQPLPGGATTLDLDAVYPEVLPGSWLVLEAPGSVDLFAVSGVSTAFRDDAAVVATTVKTPSPRHPDATAEVDSRITISGKVTRVTLDRIPGAIVALHLDGMSEAPTSEAQLREAFRRSATVLAQTEPLALAPTEVQDPVGGATIELAQPAPAFPGDRVVVLTGRAPAARVPDHVRDLYLVGPEEVPVPPGTVLTILPPDPDAPPPDGPVPVWHVSFGRHTGTLITNLLVFVDAPPASPVFAESATVPKRQDQPAPTEPPQLHLGGALKYQYDRASCRVLANVAPATHGESAGVGMAGDSTKREIPGSGDASPCQTFRLSKPNLTYTPAGSTLHVEVNGVAWKEVPNLAHSGRNDPHFFVRVDEAGVSTLIFGDGITGARLPTGHENITAIYRSGIGVAGMLNPDQLTQLVARPFGVKAVTNPLPPVGGADPDPPDAFRASAASHLRTMTRVVALDDYEGTARSWGGIGKALAVALHQHGRRVIHLTLAGNGGQPIERTADPAALLHSLRRNGDPHQPVVWSEAEVLTFEAAMRIYLQPPDPGGTLPPALTVAKAAIAAVLAQFGFDNRELAQPVRASELIAVVQTVPKVAGVALDVFGLTQRSESGAGPTSEQPPGPTDILPAAGTRMIGDTILPAQLLIVAPSGPTITEVLPA